MDALAVEFEAEIWHWRGPSPYHFVSIPSELARVLKDLSAVVTYGWGMIPATIRIGETEWRTSLFPKDGVYAVPIRDKVRRAENLQVGQIIFVRVEVP